MKHPLKLAALIAAFSVPLFGVAKAESINGFTPGDGIELTGGGGDPITITNTVVDTFTNFEAATAPGTDDFGNDYAAGDVLFTLPNGDVWAHVPSVPFDPSMLQSEIAAVAAQEDDATISAITLNPQDAVCDDFSVRVQSVEGGVATDADISTQYATSVVGGLSKIASFQTYAATATPVVQAIADGQCIGDELVLFFSGPKDGHIEITGNFWGPHRSQYTGKTEQKTGPFTSHFARGLETIYAVWSGSHWVHASPLSLISGALGSTTYEETRGGFYNISGNGSIAGAPLTWQAINLPFALDAGRNESITATDAVGGTSQVSGGTFSGVSASANIVTSAGGVPTQFLVAWEDDGDGNPPFYFEWTISKAVRQ